jgi:hypothetical protein
MSLVRVVSPTLSERLGLSVRKVNEISIASDSSNVSCGSLNRSGLSNLSNRSGRFSSSSDQHLGNVTAISGLNGTSGDALVDNGNEKHIICPNRQRTLHRRCSQEAGFLSPPAVKPVYRGSTAIDDIKVADLRTVSCLVQYQTTLTFFTNFCTSSYCQENVMLWLDAEGFAALPSSVFMCRLAFRLYMKYIEPKVCTAVVSAVCLPHI